MSANYKTLNSVQLLKKKGIEQGLKSIFPVVFFSNHVNKHVRSNSWFYIIVGTIYFITKLLFTRKRKFPINTKYHVLFYVPNNKYKKFVDALTSNVSFSYLIISEEVYLPNVFSVDDYKLLKAEKYPLNLLRVVSHLFIYSLKTKELSDFKKHYWSILSLIRRDFTAKALFEHVAFEKYFSFHPVEGFHQVIQNFYKESFKETYAIRPTTTSMSKEHQFISTDNLFYKTENELQIYQYFNLHTVQLLKGGLLAIPKTITEKSNKNGVLFLDTCTNKNLESISIRRKAVSQFLDYANNSNFNIYFKFHPGLIEKEERFTKKQIDSFSNQKIKIIESEIPWEEIRVAIGFDTTLFYECILFNIPVVSFREKYCLFSTKANEFIKSPIIPVKHKTDFEIISRLLNDESFCKSKNDDQLIWFLKQYNYPEGMNTIKRILAK